MIDYVGMGDCLADARRLKHISQERVAEMVNVSVWTIRNIEGGKTLPHMETIFALWDIYDLPREKMWDFFSRSQAVDEQLKKFETA